jgi:hypothetical protein
MPEKPVTFDEESDFRGLDVVTIRKPLLAIKKCDEA